MYMLSMRDNASPENKGFRAWYTEQIRLLAVFLFLVFLSKKLSVCHVMDDRIVK